MHDLLAHKTAGLDIPIATIPNWAELESVEPRPRVENALLAGLGLMDKFVFLYAGNMGHPNDMESVLDAAAALVNNPHIHFIFLGSGVKRPWLERSTKERGLTNVTILDPLPRSEQLNFLNACDVAIVTLISKMKGVSMPSRTYNALAAGKPILGIVEDGSEVAYVVADDDVGWIVPPHRPDLLREVITHIYQSKQELPAIGERARHAALERYSLQLALERYRAVLK
jgi:glycosyltransferase involved in cell wall biosynthesis